MSRRFNVRRTARSQHSPLELRLSRRFSRKERAALLNSLTGLPALFGSPILVSARGQLTAHRGKLLSGEPGRGIPVHAASFIRERRIVLETELLNRLEVLPLIAVHEVFHFVWVRAGNPARREYAELLRTEWAWSQRRARRIFFA